MEKEKNSSQVNPHAKHRERVRDLFVTNGFDGFPDHAILEMILFYSIPQKDTNELAHKLIDEFGSLRGVLDTPTEVLEKVKGIGHYTAVYLSMISRIAKQYYFERTGIRLECSDTEAIKKYVRARFMGEADECLYVLSFGSDGFMKNFNKLTMGENDAVLMDKRSVLQTAINNNASFIVLAHNHPGGVAAPSTGDITATRDLIKLLNDLGIVLYDHIIASGDEVFSMIENHKFATLFIV